MKNILAHIHTLVPLSSETERALTACLTPCRFPKKTLLVSEGRRTGAAFFIERGLTRSYWLVNGEEITTSFSAEGSIVFSMDELYYGKPSEEFVETLEETEAYRIALDDLQRLFRTNLELANWGAHHPPERIPPPAPLAQGAAHPLRRRTLRRLLQAVSRTDATGATGLHRLLPGHHPPHPEPAQGAQVSFCRRTNAVPRKMRTFAPLNKSPDFKNKLLLCQDLLLPPTWTPNPTTKSWTACAG